MVAFSTFGPPRVLDEYEAAKSWADIHPYSQHLRGGPFDWNAANSEVLEILKSGLYPYGIARPNLKSIRGLLIFSFKRDSEAPGSTA